MYDIVIDAGHGGTDKGEKNKVSLIKQEMIKRGFNLKEIKFGDDNLAFEELEKACEIARANEFILEREDKENICKEFSADVFVDDDLDITARVKELCPNTKTFVMNSNYNRDKLVQKGTNRIFKLNEIVEENYAEEGQM